jgi:hypothetical protein
MTIGQINFLQSYIPKNNNYSTKANKTISFGTRLVNVDKLVLSFHAQQRMKQKNISLDIIKKGIKRGIAYLEEKSNHVAILAKSKKERDLFVVLDPTGTDVITVFRPDPGIITVLEDGKLCRQHYYDPSKSIIYAPIPEDTKLPTKHLLSL